jgi:hypothetical protein
MARAKIPTNTHGPAIRGVDPWAPSAGKMRQFLSAEERVRLAVLSSIVRLNKGEEIYREGQHTDAVFNIITGVVKALVGRGEQCFFNRGQPFHFFFKLRQLSLSRVLVSSTRPRHSNLRRLLSLMVFAGSSPITTTSPSSKAHQKSGPFPQPALPGFNGHTTPSDSRHGRRLFLQLLENLVALRIVSHRPAHLCGKWKHRLRNLTVAVRQCRRQGRQLPCDSVTCSALSDAARVGKTRASQH